MIGHTENLLGAWQLARKTGRAHSQQMFLEMNQNDEKNYFAILGNAFIDEFIPYITGEKVNYSFFWNFIKFNLINCFFFAN